MCLVLSSTKAVQLLTTKVFSKSLLKSLPHRESEQRVKKLLQYKDSEEAQRAYSRVSYPQFFVMAMNSMVSARGQIDHPSSSFLSDPTSLKSIVHLASSPPICVLINPSFLPLGYRIYLSGYVTKKQAKRAYSVFMKFCWNEWESVSYGWMFMRWE